MQEKPDSTTGQTSTARRKTSSESSAAGASTSSAKASPAVGASGSGVIDQAKEAITNVAGQAGDKVTSRLDGQKDRAAEGIGSVAQALRQAGDQLRDQNQGGGIHEYVSSAADQIERLSGYLRSTNMNQMVNQVEQFARRQPAIFLGGAFVLGLLGARFLKSSSPSSAGQSTPYQSGESLVARSSYSGPQAYRQGDVGTQGNIGTRGTASTGYSSPGTGYSSPTPIPRREDF